MKKTDLRFCVDALLFISIVGIVLIGFLLGFVLRGGTGGVRGLQVLPGASSARLGRYPSLPGRGLHGFGGTSRHFGLELGQRKSPATFSTGLDGRARVRSYSRFFRALSFLEPLVE